MPGGREGRRERGKERGREGEEGKEGKGGREGGREREREREREITTRTLATRAFNTYIHVYITTRHPFPQPRAHPIYTCTCAGYVVP